MAPGLPVVFLLSALLCSHRSWISQNVEIVEVQQQSQGVTSVKLVLKQSQVNKIAKEREREGEREGGCLSLLFFAVVLIGWICYRPPFVYRVISYYEDPGLTWLFTLRHIVTFTTLDVLTYCVITFNFASLNQNLAQKLISEWRFNSSVKQKWLWLQDGEKFQHVSRFMPITML